MKSRVKYEAVATIGEYQDRQTGATKKRYLKVGTVFESEDGRLSLKLDAMPCGPNWSGYIQFFDPKPRDGQQLPEGRRNSPGMPPAPTPVVDPSEHDDEDIPF